MYDEFEGLTLDKINYLIEYFDIKDVYIFNYYYHEESVLAIGSIQEGECIYWEYIFLSLILYHPFLIIY